MIPACLKQRKALLGLPKAVPPSATLACRIPQILNHPGMKTGSNASGDNGNFSQGYARPKQGWVLLLNSVALTLSILLMAAGGVKEMNVNLGEEFTISLEANPTTGYDWEPIYDAHFLKLKGKKFEPVSPQRPESSLPPGSPGKAVFTFIPIKPGQTTIKMVYQRPWEKTPAQEETFTVVVNAK